MTAEKAERQSAAFMSCAQEMTKLRTTSVVIGSAAAMLRRSFALRVSVMWPPAITSACQS